MLGRMGFDHYDQAELERIVAHWQTGETVPGSLGEKAKRDSLAELERRRIASARSETEQPTQ